MSKPSRNDRTQTRHDSQPSRRIFTPVTVGITLAVIALGITALVSRTRGVSTDQDHLSQAPAATRPTASPIDPMARAIVAQKTPATSKPVGSLPFAPAGTRQPINDADPSSGKIVTASSPTIKYKGYVIGFCCEKSGGYRGGWERMSESEKDAFVRKCLGY